MLGKVFMTNNDVVKNGLVDLFKKAVSKEELIASVNHVFTVENELASHGQDNDEYRSVVPAPLAEDFAMAWGDEFSAWAWIVNIRQHHVSGRNWAIEKPLECAKCLWQAFADIPVNNEDELEAEFLHFEIGTDKYDVWHWFESEFGFAIALATAPNLDNSVEYVFKTGYDLRHFFAEFTKSVELAPKPDFKSITTNGQFIHAIAMSDEAAIGLVRDHYNSLGVNCKEIALVKPVTTTNEDLKYLSQPRQVLGFDSGVVIKTASAKRVLQLMDSCSDGGSRYTEFVEYVAEEFGIPVAQLNEELEPFV